MSSINLFKPSGRLTYHQLKHPKILHGVHTAFMCFSTDFLPSKTLTDWSRITEVEAVYCAVSTKSLYKTYKFRLSRVKFEKK